jgi:acyl-coenzyme A synthetase/AMP-(fatty) acid ligase
VLRNPVREDELRAFARELVDFCLARLAYFKAPGYVAFCSQLPLTATAKIQRAKLSELARQALQEGRAIDLRAMKKRTA